MFCNIANKVFKVNMAILIIVTAVHKSLQCKDKFKTVSVINVNDTPMFVTVEIKIHEDTPVGISTCNILNNIKHITSNYFETLFSPMDNSNADKNFSLDEKNEFLFLIMHVVI